MTVDVAAVMALTPSSCTSTSSPFPGTSSAGRMQNSKKIWDPPTSCTTQTQVWSCKVASKWLKRLIVTVGGAVEQRLRFGFWLSFVVGQQDWVWSREVEPLGTRSPAPLQRDFCCACIVDSEHTQRHNTLCVSFLHTQTHQSAVVKAGVCKMRTTHQQY